MLCNSIGYVELVKILTDGKDEPTFCGCAEAYVID